MMRAFAAMLFGCAILAGCGEPPAAPAPFRTAVTSPPPAAPAPAPASSGLNIADYMYGPPPHNRIDPRMRCRFDCPTYPANLPPPVQ
jgi:hypothetical protein